MLNFKDIHTVAIIGASEDTKKIGNILLEKNQHFSGEIYGVNPKGGSAYGRVFYPSISLLPSVPDVAVFALPAPLVATSLEEAGKCGVKKAIIITAGFKEVGNHDGEKELQSIAQKYHIRLLGPNCLGYGDTTKGLNLSFGGRFFSPGNIGIISQSGAMAVAITDILDSRGLGFSQFYSLGNKSDIDESDLLLELLEDEHTAVIALYLESIARGQVFLETLTKVTVEKPVIVMMGGMSDRGKVATASHTGSLSGNRATIEAVLSQGGAHLTYSLDDFFALLEVHSLSPGVTLTGSPYIITNAGGPGVLATDQAEFYGISLARITPEADARLRVGMPAVMSTRNPIDIIGDADSARVLQILENLHTITSRADILFLFTVQATTDIDTIAEVIVDFRQKHPGFTCFVALIGGETVTRAREILERAGIPTMSSPESLISLYASLLPPGFTKHQDTSRASHTTLASLNLLDQTATEQLLEKYDIASTGMIETDSFSDIETQMSRYSAPYILKVAGKTLAHKTELGGIIGPVSTRDEVRSAFDILSEKSGGRVAFGRYIEKNPTIELFFGAKRDSVFGDVYIIGIGGIYLTLHADKTLHVGEWATHEALRETILFLRWAPALLGYREQKPADIEALVDMISSLVSLFRAELDIREIDINPILFADGAPVIADAKFYLAV